MHLTVEAPPKLQRESVHASGTSKIPVTREHAFVVVVLVLAWLLHWRTFSTAELGVDGALSIDLALGPLREMLAFTVRDTHPPLFYALMHWWFIFAGPHELTAKYVPIACSTATLAILYRIGVRLLGGAAGLLAVLLFAASPAYVMMSPTVRDFAVGLCLSLVTLWLSVSLADRIERGGNPIWIGVLLALTTTAALLTWYFHLAFVLAELGIIVAVQGRARRSALNLLWPLLAGIAAAVPWYAFAIPTIARMLLGGVTAFDRAPSLPSAQDAFSYVSEAVVGLNHGGLAAAGLAAWLVVVVAGVVTCRAKDRNEKVVPARLTSWLLCGGLAIGMSEALPFALRWAEPGAISRYILAVLPFVAMLQAGAAWTKQRVARPIAVAALLCVCGVQAVWAVGLLSSTPIPYTDDPAFAYLDGHVRAGDVVVFSDRQRRARFLLHGAHTPTAVIQTAGARYLTTSVADAERTTKALVAHERRLWLVLSNQPPYAEPVAQTALASQAYVAEERTFDSPSPPLRLFLDSKLSLFETGTPTGAYSTVAHLGASVSLVRAAYTTDVQPGTGVNVQLVWRADQAVDVAYSVFVHLDDAQGHLIAQHDGTPMAGLRPTNHWRSGETILDQHALLLRQDLQPGDYRLNAGMYRGAERLKQPDGSDTIPLGSVHVGS